MEPPTTPAPTTDGRVAERPVEPTIRHDDEAQEAGEPTADAPQRNRLRKIVLFALLAVALIAGAIYGWNWYQFAQAHASTDNAQVEGTISPVLPRVDGYVAEVLVEDNERVAAGQVLARIDPRDLSNGVEQAEAALEQAQTQLRSAQAQVQVARAQAARAEAAQRQAQTEQNRQSALEPGVATTQQAYDNAASNTESAEAQSAAAREQVSAAEAGVAQARAQVQQRQAALDDAQLQRSYTEIKAPISGRVSQKDVEPGQYIRPGQPIMAIAKDQDVWVVANFKEGQIAGIKPGQPVDVEVDAYPDRTFHGRVQSIAGATGSQFALLPPDNASGNFVKVEQRIPVKIVFTDPADPEAPLRPGMNAVPTVRTKPAEDDRRG